MMCLPRAWEREQQGTERKTEENKGCKKERGREARIGLAVWVACAYVTQMHNSGSLNFLYHHFGKLPSSAVL